VCRGIRFRESRRTSQVRRACRRGRGARQRIFAGSHLFLLFRRTFLGGIWRFTASSAWASDMSPALARRRNRSEAAIRLTAVRTRLIRTDMETPCVFSVVIAISSVLDRLHQPFVEYTIRVADTQVWRAFACSRASKWPISSSPDKACIATLRTRLGMRPWPTNRHPPCRIERAVGASPAETLLTSDRGSPPQGDTGRAADGFHGRVEGNCAPVPLDDEVGGEGHGEVPGRRLQVPGHGRIRFPTPFCWERY
jgi:hypothetical protein